MGKTLVAKAVAGEAHVPFFSISASEFVEMFVGVGASRVRDLFSKAKAAAPAIVFVDEIDAVGRERGAGTGGGNDEREQTLNQLLVEMDGFDERHQPHRDRGHQPARRPRSGVAAAGPVRPPGHSWALRTAAGERPSCGSTPAGCRWRPTSSSPPSRGRRRASPAPTSPTCATRPRCSLPAKGGARSAADQFEEALDKIILGTKQAALTDADERRTVAYHEGGHALVALLTPGADPVQKVTIVPHGRALGVTEQRPDEDRRNYPRSYLLARLAVMLGGRAAEEVVMGQPTTGAESDLKGATDLARRMVGLWGMSDELGPVSYGVGETHPFLGRELAAGHEYAESTATRIDAAVSRLLEEARGQATDLLLAHRATLDALAAELVEREIVTGTRLGEILAETEGRVEGRGERADEAARQGGVPAAALSAA